MANGILQGKLDGFCGVYCLAHVLAKRSDDCYESEMELNFYKLLKAAEDRELLTASKIAGKAPGYTDRELCQLFFDLPIARRKRLHAVAISTRAFQASRFYRQPRILEQIDASIILKEGERHWIAVTSIDVDGGHECFDPWPERRTTERRNIGWSSGLIIAPTSQIGEL